MGKLIVGTKSLHSHGKCATNLVEMVLLSVSR